MPGTIHPRRPGEDDALVGSDCLGAGIDCSMLGVPDELPPELAQYVAALRRELGQGEQVLVHSDALTFAEAVSGLAEVTRRLGSDSDSVGDPPIFREVEAPAPGVDTVRPWDGVGPDLGPVLSRLAEVRSMPACEPVTELERLLAGLAGDVEALLAEVRVRRAAPPGVRPVADLGQEC